MPTKPRPVTKAILPVAGLGTRFLPATKALPKEMLPIIDKPILQYLVEDMVAAGIKDIIFVTAIGKRALEDHFDRNFELEYRLEQKKKKAILKEIAKIGKLANFAFVRQPKPLGDGHAVLQALPFVDDDEPIMTMFGDDLTIGIAQELVDAYKEHDASILNVIKVPKADTKRYGIIGGTKINKHLWRADQWVEKPAPKEAPSNLAWTGPCIMKPDVWKLLYEEPESAGEIRLAGAFDMYFKDGGTMLAHVVDPSRRFDVGNKLDYIKAQIYFGLQRDEFKKDLRAYMKSLL